MSDEVTQAFATLRRHLPASLRAQGAALEAAWFNGGPLHRRTREPAAPEGVDAADERATSVERMAHVEEVANLERHLGYAHTGVAALLRRLDELEGKDRGLTYIDVAEVRRLLAAAPDARRRIQAELDLLRSENGELRRIRGTARRMIDHRDEKLTAAQAAIQRVRELADEWAQSGAPVLTNLAAHLLRALDGDTTGGEH